MADVAAEFIPLALAIAASPFSIIPAILVLFTPSPRAAGGAFLAGWVLALATTATAFTLLASVIELLDEAPTWLSWTRIVLGLVLVVLGIRQWLRRRVPKPAPAWMRSIEAASPRKAFRLAFVLAVANPKILLLTAAAGLGIGAAALGPTITVTAIATFTVVASVSVAVPVLLYLVRGERMLDRLTRARDWLERHNAAVMAVVLIVIGMAVTANGVAGLA